MARTRDVTIVPGTGPHVVKDLPVQGVKSLFRCIHFGSNYNPNSGQMLPCVNCLYTLNFLYLHPVEADFGLSGCLFDAEMVSFAGPWVAELSPSSTGLYFR